jgi:hypothetical protein
MTALACGSSNLRPLQARLEATPRQLDFGVAVVSQVEYRSVTLSNIGAVALELTGVEVTGGDSPAFALEAPASKVLAADSSLELRVQFEPMREGSFTATLQIETDSRVSPVLLIPLVGFAQRTFDDAGVDDAGSADAGSTDAGGTDAGGTDAGSTDAGSTDAGARATWVNTSPQRPTPTGGDQGVAYDELRERVVLFGGWGPGYQQETWEWDGRDWTLAHPASAPSARYQSMMAFDRSRGRVVLFGGRLSSTSLASNDMWEWDGTNWSQLSPSGSQPPPRFLGTMAYDSMRRRLVLFGGVQTNWLNDTWEWDGTTWLQRFPATSPASTGVPSMAFDETNGKMLLVTSSLETWTWDGTTWTRLSPTTTPPTSPRAFPPTAGTLVYDAHRGRVLLVAAASTQTWEWSGSNWSRVTTANFSLPVDFAAVAFDRARNQTVAFGGASYNVEYLNNTWLLTGALWTRMPPPKPPGRRHSAAAVDPLRHRCVIYGGSGSRSGYAFSDTWEWDGTDWSNPLPSNSPGAREKHAMAYDPVGQRVILFGGLGAGVGFSNDTWSWDGTTWSKLSPLQSPSGRASSNLVLDPQSGHLLLFGGRDSAGLLADTWEWTGANWLQRLPAASPTARDEACLTADPIRGRVVLFAGQVGASGSASSDTWEWDGATWLDRTTSVGPPARRSGAMGFEAIGGRVILHGGVDAGSFSNDTWAWDGTSWSRVNASQSPKRWDHLMVTHPNTGHVVLIAADDRETQTDTWALMP